MRNKKKILIAEPSYIITSGLEKILAESPHFEILMPINETDSLKNRLAVHLPDILIVNPTLFVDTNSHSVRNIKHEYPKTALIALVYQYVDPLLLKLFHGTLDIRENKNLLNGKISDICAALNPEDWSEENSCELSKRETDVLILLAKGMMNKEVAEKLNISVHTVISHRKNISRKTNIKSVAGLAMYALMNNLIEEGSIRTGKPEDPARK
jgi:DNA-binding NarL/FixJ family response regulator